MFARIIIGVQNEVILKLKLWGFVLFSSKTAWKMQVKISWLWYTMCMQLSTRHLYLNVPWSLNEHVWKSTSSSCPSNLLIYLYSYPVNKIFFQSCAHVRKKYGSYFFLSLILYIHQLSNLVDFIFQIFLTLVVCSPAPLPVPMSMLYIRPLTSLAWIIIIAFLLVSLPEFSVFIHQTSDRIIFLKSKSDITLTQYSSLDKITCMAHSRSFMASPYLFFIQSVNSSNIYWDYFVQGTVLGVSDTTVNKKASLMS